MDEVRETVGKKETNFLELGTRASLKGNPTRESVIRVVN